MNKFANHHSWTFFTNHSHVLFYLAHDSNISMREVAEEVGITERAVQRIVRELVDIKVIEISRRGRRNHYTVNRDVRLRHQAESHKTVGELLDFIGSYFPRKGGV